MTFGTVQTFDADEGYGSIHPEDGHGDLPFSYLPGMRPATSSTMATTSSSTSSTAPKGRKRQTSTSPKRRDGYLVGRVIVRRTPLFLSCQGERIAPRTLSCALESNARRQLSQAGVIGHEVQRS